MLYGLCVEIWGKSGEASLIIASTVAKLIANQKAMGYVFGKTEYDMLVDACLEVYCINEIKAKPCWDIGRIHINFGGVLKIRNIYGREYIKTHNLTLTNACFNAILTKPLRFAFERIRILYALGYNVTCADLHAVMKLGPIDKIKLVEMVKMIVSCRQIAILDDIAFLVFEIYLHTWLRFDTLCDILTICDGTIVFNMDHLIRVMRILQSRL